ncbi:MAG: DUF2852 domain-containing protein [Pseudomonadota bacterium]
MNTLSVADAVPPKATPRNTPSALTPRNTMPLAVQIIGTVLYGGFAIVAVTLAFIHSWPAGVALTGFLAWRGGFTPQGFSQPDTNGVADQARALSPGAGPAPESSGNASFDAYRRDMLARLEQEQEAFDGFLERLRRAKDSAEFDQFMEDRAQRASETR